MISKSPKLKKKIEEVQAKVKQWTFEITGSVQEKNFTGRIKTEDGKVMATLLENEDFDSMTALVSRDYLKDVHDMKGLAKWVFERNLLALSSNERNEWTKKKKLPIDIREVKV